MTNETTASRPTRPIWPKTGQRMARWLDQPLISAMVRRTAVDDVLGALHPMLSLTEVRARVTSICRETADTTTFFLQANTHWQGARAGQFVRVRVEINGRQMERVYSISGLTGEAGMAITVKRQPGGLVSNHLHDVLRVGDVLTLSQAAGDFVLPAVAVAALPRKILLLSAGSGITPVMAMLRSLQTQRFYGRLVFVHMCHDQSDLIFSAELQHLAATMPGLRLVTHFTQLHGRLDAAALTAMLPDVAEYSTWMCGPGMWMENLHAHWSAHLPNAPLYSERFGNTPTLLAIEGAAAHIQCTTTGTSFTARGTDSLLVQAERTGMSPKHGCRMGICASCQCTKTSGTVQNLVTGDISSAPNETIRLCISAARSDLSLAL